MRISSNLFFQTGLNSINAQQSDLVHLYKQVGSGKRMVTPSDDPLAAAQAINVSQTLAMGERYAANRKVASQNLGMQENVFNSVTLQLQEIKTNLVEAGNGTWSAPDRAAMAEVLETARAGLLNLANSTDGNGQYLFSGALGKTAPFTSAGVYQGSNHARLVQVDQTRQLDSADIGTNIFSRAAPGTSGYVTIPGSNGGTAAVTDYSIDNAGGIANGRTMDISFSDGVSGLQYTVSIATEAGPVTYTYDVPAPGPDGSVTLGDSDMGLSVTLAGEATNGDTFKLVPLHASGYTIGPSTSTAVVRSVDGYNGESLSLTFDATTAPGKFVQGGVDYPVVEDSTFTPPRYSVDVDGIVVRFDTLPADAEQLSLSQGPSSQSNADLNLFAALDSVIAALRDPGTDAVAAANMTNSLNSAMQRVDAIYNNVLSVRASAGTRMNEITALDANGNERVLEYKNQLSKLEDLDYYTAITQLQLRTTALEAAAMAFQKIQNTSLFNLNARG